MENHLCYYGCGKKATHQFKNNKYCCSKSATMCENQRKKFSKIKKEIPLNKKQLDQITNLGKSRLGTSNSKESYEKMKRTREKNYQIKKNSYDSNRKIIDFKNIDSEEKAYLLGFIYADGCVWKNPKKPEMQFKIRLSINDMNHLIKIGKFFNKIPKICKTSIHNDLKQSNKVTRYDKDYECSQISCGDRMLIEQLIEKGIYPNKSKNDRSSDAFDNVPINLKHHFIRGMVDGDGCFSPVKNKNCIMFSLCGINNIMLEKINDEISKKCEFQRHDVKKLETNCYNFQYWRNDNIEKISRYLYNNATIYLDRKKAIVEKYL